jgi:regulatory protein
MTENILYKTALSKVMAICSRREYCIEDIRGKLQSWGAGEKDTKRIIETLIKENFINEIRYSEAFVKDKFNYNKWGKIKIAAHLKSKSIPGDLIRSSLDSIDDELYKKTLKEIIFSHRKSVKAKNQYDLKGKLLRYGLSKGFESRLLYDLLNDPD